jgi:hypothetical protein
VGRNARTCGNRGCVGSTDGWKMSNCWTRFMRRKRNDSVALDRTLGGTECDRRSCDPDRALQAPPSRFSPASIDGVIRIEGKMLHPLLGAGSRGSLEVPREANLRDGFRPYKSAPEPSKNDRLWGECVNSSSQSTVHSTREERVLRNANRREQVPYPCINIP